MSIDFSKYKEMETGKKTKSKIIEIQEGKQSDFRTEEYWAASDMSKQQIGEQKNRPAINIVTDNKASLVINLPSGVDVHPKSTLALFKRTYKVYPSVDMEVDTQTDNNGFQRIVLEK